MNPATIEAAGKAYRNEARFHLVCDAIVSQEMAAADAVFDEIERIEEADRLRLFVWTLATNVAARVLQTIYENDAELAEWKGLAERLQAAGLNLAMLSPQPPTVIKP